MSNEKKQSSVEWLFSQLPDEFTSTRVGYDMLQQAKAMHKEEHVKTFGNGMQWLQYQRDSNIDKKSWEKEPKQFKDYYNETFNP